VKAKRKKVPVPDNHQNSETLEGFAKCVEERLAKSYKLGPFATQRLVCRIMTKAGPQQAHMIEKWVEWRYGKAKDRSEITGDFKVIVEHIGGRHSKDSPPTKAE
jgi:hypothetical protein